MAANAQGEKKIGFFGRIARFFRDSKGELKKVVWPSKKQVVNNTAIVIAFVLIAAVIIGAFDYILSFLIALFLKA